MGDVLADGVIAARPFPTLDDATRVPGIGPGSLQSLLDRFREDHA